MMTKTTWFTLLFLAFVLGFCAAGVDAQSIRVQVLDAAGNVISTTTIPLVPPPPPPPPAPPPAVSIFAATDKPANEQSTDVASYELGVKFTSTVAGKVRGIRFYKGPLNVGPHSVHLWDGNGVSLASDQVPEVTLSGWQERSFSSGPVTIEAGKTYVASYFCPKGHYSYSTQGFQAAKVAGVLNAPIGAGVFVGRPTSGFPNQTFANTNYWVDVLFEAGVASAPNPRPLTLAWDPPTNSADGSPLNDLAGYVLLRGQQPSVLDIREILGLESEWSGELMPGPYWFQVKARDTTGNESAPTATLAVTVQ